MEEEIAKNTELSQQINDTEFELKKIDAEIAGINATKAKLQQAREGTEVVSEVEAGMQEALALEQNEEKVQLRVDVQKLR